MQARTSYAPAAATLAATAMLKAKAVQCQIQAHELPHGAQQHRQRSNQLG